MSDTSTQSTDSIPLSNLDRFTVLIVIITAIYLGFEAAHPAAYHPTAFVILDWVLVILLMIEFMWRTRSAGVPTLPGVLLFRRLRGLAPIYKSGDTSGKKKNEIGEDSVSEMDFIHSFLYYLDLCIILTFLFTLLGALQFDLHELSLVRILRTLMIVRVLDIGPLRDFVTTVFHSIRSVTYAGIVVLVHFYIYAVIGTFLFRRVATDAFGTLSDSCSTLMSVNTGNGFSDILRALEQASESYGTIGLVYFGSYVFVGVVLLLGIVTAMITNDVWDHRNKGNLAISQARASGLPTLTPTSPPTDPRQP